MRLKMKHLPMASNKAPQIVLGSDASGGVLKAANGGQSDI